MDILAFIFLVALFLVGFKILGLVFKAGIFLLSIPLLIVFSVVGAVLMLAVVPAVLTGLVTVLFLPLGLLGPLLPFLLVGLGLWLILKH